MPVPPAQQLPLSESDREKLAQLIRNDYTNDSVDLSRRNNAMRRWYRLWRNVPGDDIFPDQDQTNFSIPLVLWSIKAKLAKELSALLGDESEIIVNPVGEMDVKRAAKIARWMNWRVKTSLKLYSLLYEHLLQKSVCGTSISYLGWKSSTRTVKQMEKQYLLGIIPIGETLVEKEVIDYDGPEFVVENLENFIIPSNAKTIEDADHIIRVLYPTVDDLLTWADEGKIDPIWLQTNLEKVRQVAQRHPDAEQTTDAPEGLRDERKEQTGLPAVPQGREQRIRIYNWIGKFRFNTNDDGTGGDPRSTQIVGFYSPDMVDILGVCRLVDMFHDGRRPFVKSVGIKDVNQFWGIGIAELLEPVSQEMDALHRLAIRAGEGAIGPVVFYSPASGWRPSQHKLEPFTAVPCADPNAVKSINLGQIQLEPYVILMQQLQAMAERLTSLTDPQLGRQFDRPNAPRTFGQQQMLQNESNDLLMLDIRLERESIREILRRIWEMDKRWMIKPMFFRVTEHDAQEVMTQDDFQGDPDFDIGPITALSNRAQKMQELLQMLLIAQQAQLLPVFLGLYRKALVKSGQGDIAQLVPDPTELPLPIPPEKENVKLLQGEDVHPSPFDNHAQHIAVHQQLLAKLEQQQVPVPSYQGGLTPVSASMVFGDVAAKIQAHIAEHEAMQTQGAMAILPMLQMGGGQGPQQQQNQPGNFAPESPQEQSQNQTSSAMNQGGLNLQ